MNQINQRRDFSKSYSSVRRPFAKTTAQMSHVVMGNWGSAVKTSASYNWRNSRPNFNYNSGPTFIRIVNAKGPQGIPKPVKAWAQDRLTRINREDLEEYQLGESVTCWRSKATYQVIINVGCGKFDFLLFYHCLNVTVTDLYGAIVISQRSYI
ncbi:hypothetical protein Tco_1335256 [Tanacetum coccineum]